MARRVVWHIGLMKSGTTFLQRRLEANADDLLDHGICFPTPWRRQVSGTKELIGRHRALREEEHGSWEKIRAEVDAHPGTAVLSMEYLCSARPEAVARAREQFPDAENLVVATVRDLGRSVPAMWQESLKNHGSAGWAEYVAAVRHDTGPGQHFWRQMAADKITGRWTAAFGTDAYVLLTVPPPGAPRGLLWERFCELTGVPVTADREGRRSNLSMGAASAVLMRDLNAALTDLPGPAYRRRVKHGFGNTTLASVRETDEPIGFEVPRWLRRRARRINDNLAASGVRVVGDLAELEPVDVPGVDPEKVGTDRVRDIAVAALAAQVRQRR